jgi:hypothetical protein
VLFVEHELAVRISVPSVRLSTKEHEGLESKAKGRNGLADDRKQQSPGDYQL